MKYIKTPDGHIYAVAALWPPQRSGTGAGQTWRMYLIGLDGEKRLYAEYATVEEAVKTAVFAQAFFASGRNLLVAAKNGKLSASAGGDDDLLLMAMNMDTEVQPLDAVQSEAEGDPE